jgi:glycosyltransferase involved in cell wall biosynthesis
MKETIIIHHHENIYRDNEGRLWLSAGIGLWINELAKNFDKLVVLFFETSIKKKSCDTILVGSNIEWISLGKMGNYFDYFQKYVRILKICKRLSFEYDYLLIRGFTPMQNVIWNRLKVKKKRTFYLVRNPKQPRKLSFNILNIISYLVNKIRESQFIKIAKSDGQIVANSNLIAEELEKQIGIHVPFASSNVMSMNDIAPLAIKSIKSPLTLLYVGRVLGMKGIMEMIDAVDNLIHIKGMSVKLHIVGEGDKEYINRCKTKAEELKILPNIVFLGRKNFGSELFSEYRNADIFLLPTYTEGFPRVYWEAASNSCPVVITAVGGIPYVVKDKINGCLIKPYSWEEIVEAIVKIVTNNEFRIGIIKNAYELSKQYSLEMGVKSLFNLITKTKV